MPKPFLMSMVVFLVFLGGANAQKESSTGTDFKVWDSTWYSGRMFAKGAVDTKETSKELLSRRCGQCHQLKIQGVCVTPDCGAVPLKETQSREWGKFIVWVRDLLNCPVTSQESKILVDHLNHSFPYNQSSDTVPWVEVQTLQDAWNVVSLRDLDGWLYAGVEGNDARIFRSRDGNRWQQVAKMGTIAIYGLTKFKGAYYAVGNEPTAQIFRSLDGLSWRVVSTLENEIGLLSMSIFGNRIYVGSSEGRIYRSEEGERWERVAQMPTRGEPNWVRSLVAFKGYFYAFAEQGDIYRSRDGLQWKEVNWLPTHLKTPRRLRPAVVFQDSLYVGTLSHGEIWKSRDGINWELTYDITPGVTPERDRGYVGSLKVAGQVLFAGISEGFGSGRVYRTSNGLVWEDLGLVSPHTIESLEYFKGALFAGILLPPHTKIYKASDPRIFSSKGRDS